MKKILHIASAILLGLLLALGGCKEKDDLPGKMMGKVTDIETDALIEAASVELQPSGKKTVTGADGKYEFAGLEPGRYKLYITKTGYVDYLSVEKTVISNRTTYLNPQLEKLPLPEVQTLSVTDITEQSATLQGKIISIGNPAYTEKGFVYGTAPEPSLNASGNITIPVAGSGTGIYTYSVSNLVKETIYYVRAYAKAGENVVYGDILNFILGAPYVVLETEKLMVQQQDLGVLRWADAGRICKNSTLAGYTDWRLPTLDELVVIYNHRDNIQSLQATAYWSSEDAYPYIGYQTLNMGTGRTGYGASSDFHNVRAVRSIETESLPIVEMRRVTDMARGTVVFEGNITSTGYPSYTERGFVYATQPKPTLESAQTKLTSPVTSDAIYSATVTDLPIDQTYYVRAYAVNELGTVYSANEKTFEMQAILPKVGTGKNITKNIGERKATLGGIINDEGYPAYTERGIVYGLLRNPTVEDNMKKVVSGSGTGEFFANLADLEIGNVYYVKAYAINEKGTAYGGEVTLDFHAVLPEVRTDKVTEITETGAVLNGTILSAGDPTYTEKGFVYGTMSLPSFDNPDSVAIPIVGTGTGEYNYSLSGLIDGTTYYVRAYAKVGENVTYGVTSSFKTGNPYYVVLPEVGLMVQKADLGEVDWYTAESLCKNSITAGYTDWRLPTIDELMTIYIRKNSIGGFNETLYWSSNKYDDGLPYNEDGFYTVYFYNGTIGWNGVSNQYRVRAVRTITE